MIVTDEEAVSEVIGAVLLVSLVVLGVAIVAVALFSQPPPSEVPHVSVVAGNNTTTFVLFHEGGDTLAAGNYRIYVDNGSGLVDRTDEFVLAGDDIWSIGENLTYTGGGTPERVVVSVVDSGGGETVIAEPYGFGAATGGTYADAGGSGTLPVVTVTPGTGGGGAASPIQITTPEISQQLVFSGQGQGNKHATMTAQTTLDNVTRVDFIVYRLEGQYNNDKETIMRQVENSSNYYIWDEIPILPGLSNGDEVAMIAIAYNGTKMIGCKVQVTTVTGV